MNDELAERRRQREERDAVRDALHGGGPCPLCGHPVDLHTHVGHPSLARAHPHALLCMVQDCGCRVDP